MLFLYNFQQIVLPRRFRTLSQNFPSYQETENCNLFTKQCINSYSTNWNLIHYKYNAYSGTYAELPNIVEEKKFEEELYEVDIDTDAIDDLKPSLDNITKEGYLLKGPEIGKCER